MDKYDYTIQHVAGKELYTADTLSRAPSLHEIGTEELEESPDNIERFVEAITAALPAS